MIYVPDENFNKRRENKISRFVFDWNEIKINENFKCFHVVIFELNK